MQPLISYNYRKRTPVNLQVGFFLLSALNHLTHLVPCADHPWQNNKDTTLPFGRMRFFLCWELTMDENNPHTTRHSYFLL